MTNSQRLAEVRQRLCDWLEQQPAESEAGHPIVGESVLIVDGFYAGRRFDAGNYRAVWFMEEDQLKIHAAGGELLGVFQGPQLTYDKTAQASPESEPEEIADVIAMPNRDTDSSDEGYRRAA
jgi:hypothetical protein